MNDIEAIEAAQNRQLNNYLDGNADAEANWVAAEDYVYDEILNIQDTLRVIINSATYNFDLESPDVKEILVDAIRDLV